VSEFFLQVFERAVDVHRFGQPTKESATVRECAAHHNTSSLNSISPKCRSESGGRLINKNDSHRARGTNHQGEFVSTAAAATDIVCCAIAYDRCQACFGECGPAIRK